MEFWNNIVQTAMLGTDKKQPATDDLSEELASAINSINSNETIDTEEKFLQVASVAFNYRQSGAKPSHQPAAILTIAPPEDKQYCNTEAIQALKDILYEESTGLLKIWLRLCVQKQQIITPELIPVLFDKSVQHKQLRSLVQQCAGNRGAWLSHFNKDWNFAKDASDEELWQTGTPEERKQVLLQMRSTDPAKARAWLQQVWAQENANTKAEFLKIFFSVHPADEDIEWLETLLNEKSQKVKEEAFNLLKQIPGSSIVQKYGQLLRESVGIKKERVLLGLSSKTTLAFQLPAVVDESIFKSGIEKLSNTKEFTDDEFVIYQAMQFVPPVFWQQHLSLNPEEIIQLFQKDDTKKKFIPALVLAIVRFKEIAFAESIMHNAKEFHPEIISLLELSQQDAYCTRHFKSYEDIVIKIMLKKETEWGSALTYTILEYTAKNFYNYNRSFYNQNIHLLPVDIIKILDACKPAEQYPQQMWANTADYITKLITLKTQTIKAFQ